MSALYAQFFLPLSPILAVLAAALGVTALECFPKVSLQRVKFALSTLGVLWSIIFTVLLWQQGSLQAASEVVSTPDWIKAFQQYYRLDVFSLAFYFATGVFSLISLFLIRAHFAHREGPSEIYLLLLFITTGILLLVSANSLLVIFLALELVSLPTYILVGAERRDSTGVEAALKYFLFGSLATVLLVLGITFLYANYGTLHLPTLGQRIQSYLAYQNSPQQMLIFTFAGLCLITVAGAFKVGLAPFHMWVPDTYEGAPTPITGFMGSAIKLAGFALLARILWGVFLPLSHRWVDVLNGLAVISMFAGNIAALKQDNLKRLFAYSSIAHAGYLVLALTAARGLADQFDSLFYYLFVYGMMFLGFFAVVCYLEAEKKTTNIYELSGIGFKRPVLGACLTLLVLSAAGIPPTAGFLAKYFIFLDSVKVGHISVVLLAVISSLIGAYYYLRILVYVFMKEGLDELSPLHKHPLLGLCVLLCALAMAYFSFFPGALNAL